MNECEHNTFPNICKSYRESGELHPNIQLEGILPIQLVATFARS